MQTDQLIFPPDTKNIQEVTLTSTTFDYAQRHTERSLLLLDKVIEIIKTFASLLRPHNEISSHANKPKQVTLGDLVVVLDPR